MPKGKYWYRQDSQGADAVLRRIVPDQRILRALGRLVADVVSAATIASPRSWELTLRERDLFLNVGQVAVLTVDRSRIFLCTVPIARRPTGLSYSSSKRRPAYDAVPVASARLHLPHERLLSLESSIVAALREFVREAAIAKTGSPWKYAHSPAAVDVLATVSGRRIEQPGYWNGGKEPDDN